MSESDDPLHHIRTAMTKVDSDEEMEVLREAHDKLKELRGE